MGINREEEAGYCILSKKNSSRLIIPVVIVSFGCRLSPFPANNEQNTLSNYAD